MCMRGRPTAMDLLLIDRPSSNRAKRPDISSDNVPTSAKKKRTRRIKVVPDKCPNPLFEKWLTEMRDDAAKKELKTKYVYDKALRSLRKYPLKLGSGREAIILDSFGPKICEMLDRKLTAHRLTSPDDDQLLSSSPPAPSPTLPLQRPQPKSKTVAIASATKRPRMGTTRAYVPVPRTGAHALLMTMYKNVGEGDGQAFMNKNALVAAAQTLCDKSFTVPDLGSYYTAWSSMGTLVNKGLVCKKGNPAKYSLTDDGLELVRRLQRVTNCDDDAGPSQTPPRVLPLPKTLSRPSSSEIIDLDHGDDDNDVGSSKPTVFRQRRCPPTRPVITEAEDGASQGSTAAASTVSTSWDDFCLHPGEFEVVLCVDNCETVAGAYNERRLMIQSELRKNGVTFDVRKLHVGDFLWVARERVSVQPGQLQLPKARELVLDFVVERKRMDDLAASIMDGRFHEQKYRLKNCDLSHRIYLIEAYGSFKNRLSLPESSLQQAIANTQIVDGFTVKHTKDVIESVAYLTLMTRYLQSIYSLRTLHSRSVSTTTDDRYRLITFDEFNRSSMKLKPTSVTEMFIRQLAQVSGMSVERSRAVARRCSTPAELFDRYARCATQAKRESLFASVDCGPTGRNLGMVISKLLCRLYNSSELH